MTIHITTNEGTRTVAPRPELHFGLASMRPETRDQVLAAAEKHELTFLERLQEMTAEHGPDGVIIKTEFEATVLGVLISVLREAQGLD